MRSAVTRRLARLLKVHPLPIVTRLAAMRLPLPVRFKEQFDATARPQYLCGLLKGADQARREGVREICAVEFGVAGGNGLLALESCARLVARETGVRIRVYGFDTGSGLPELCGDHRDHPDDWVPADYPMDPDRLRRRLAPETRLILGDVRETVPRFVSNEQPCPVGFAAFDLDLYSSTRDALALFGSPTRRMLLHTPCCFDDVSFFSCHARAGELLAIDEFNRGNGAVFIDRWRGIAHDRAFPLATWLEKMHVAHDLAAISGARAARPPLAHLALE